MFVPHSSQLCFLSGGGLTATVCTPRWLWAGTFSPWVHLLPFVIITSSFHPETSGWVQISVLLTSGLPHHPLVGWLFSLSIT